jgi:hypothetical protein
MYSRGIDVRKHKGVGEVRCVVSLSRAAQNEHGCFAEGRALSGKDKGRGFQRIYGETREHTSAKERLLNEPDVRAKKKEREHAAYKHSPPLLKETSDPDTNLHTILLYCSL